MQYIQNFLAALAVLISLLALKKAGQAFEHSKTTASALNTPILTFEVTESHALDRGVCMIEVLIRNGGQYPTEIVKGQIALKSHNYPEAEKPRKLDGLKVFSGTPRSIKFEVKHALIQRNRPEVPATQLICEAVYTRLNQENGEARECYTFNETQGRFESK